MQSIAQQQYYAHPQNAFWPLVAALFDFKLSMDYQCNVQALTSCQVAVWDVLSACERKGSLDAAIVRGSEVLNPIQGLVADHPSITRIGLNGGAAFALFCRHHRPWLQSTHLKVVKLPSTSPAHAAMSRDQKRAAWAKLLEIEAL